MVKYNVENKEFRTSRNILMQKPFFIEVWGYPTLRESANFRVSTKTLEEEKDKFYVGMWHVKPKYQIHEN